MRNFIELYEQMSDKHIMVNLIYAIWIYVLSNLIVCEEFMWLNWYILSWWWWASHFAKIIISLKLNIYVQNINFDRIGRKNINMKCHKIIKLVNQEFSLLKLYLNSYKYPGGKLRSILILSPFYSDRHISLARASLSVLVPLLCLSFIWRFKETSEP